MRGYCRVSVHGKKGQYETSRTVTLTLFSANGVTTIKREVFEGLNVKWKGTEVESPAVVLPGAGVDFLLGISRIVKASIRLGADRQVLIHGVRSTPLKQFMFQNLLLGPSSRSYIP